MPTVLDLLDVPQPPVDGVSLAGVMIGSGATSTRGLFGVALSGAVRVEPATRVARRPVQADRRPETGLYDLQRDPFEERNLFDERRSLADAMMRRLEALDPGQGPARVSEEAVVPAALQENLAALGYVTPAPMRASRDGKDLPDPKDCVGLMGVNLRLADRQIWLCLPYDRVRCDSAIRVKSHMDRAIAKSEIADPR